MPALTYSKGFNLPISGDELAGFGFIKLQNGAQTLTAIKSDFQGGGGGATSLNTSGVNFFHTDSNAQQGTVSVKTGLGLQYFATPTNNTQQNVSVASNGGSGQIKVTQSAETSNQSLANKLSNWSTTQYMLAAGVVAGAVLLIAFLRK